MALGVTQTSYPSMPLKRGTIVEFVGAVHESHHLFKEHQFKDFFDKYGLQVGDQGKIWEGYRGSWIRITWTRQDGTKAHRVPMRSGNFKVVDEPDKSDSDSDSVPELESNEEPVVDSPPVATQENMINSLRTILKSVRAENRELKEEVNGLNTHINITYAARGQEIIELHELAASRADQIDGLLGELDIIKRSHATLSGDLEESKLSLWELQESSRELGKENRELQLTIFNSPAPSSWLGSPAAKIKKLEAALLSPVTAAVAQKYGLVEAIGEGATDTKPSDVCDEWARDQIGNITRAMSKSASINDSQQKVLQNLKSKLDEVTLKESQTNDLSAFCCQALKVNGMIVGEANMIVDKDAQDKAAIALQDVAQEYLTNKRAQDEFGEWVVPEVGSG